MKRVLASMILAGTMALAVSDAASAEVLQANPAGNITQIGLVAIGNVTCSQTLTGRMNATINLLSPNPQFYTITGRRIEECVGGTAPSPLNLPYSVKVAGVSGTLPSEMTGMELVIEGWAANFSVYGFLINCLYAGEPFIQMSVAGTRSGYVIESTELDPSVPVSFVRGSGLCPESAELEGTLTMEPTQELEF